MNPPHPNPARRAQVGELRVGLIIAALMLAIPGTARIAMRSGWVEGTGFSERALMVLIAGFIVLTGNTIPKHVGHRARDVNSDARLQAFFRVAGWVWVLAGLGLGLAWLVLPLPAAGSATLILMPTAIGLIAARWMVFRFEGRAARQTQDSSASSDVIPSKPSAPSVKPHASYTEAQYWRITDKSNRLVMVNLFALPMAVAFGLGFYWLAQSLGKAPRFDWHTGETVVFVVGLIIVLALHESVHGILMRLYGAKPRFGFFAKGGMFYAKAPGYIFTRQQYLIVVLGPLVILSLMAVLSMALVPGTQLVWVASLWGIMNASAANADVWIAVLILKYPAASYVVDERDGLRILMPSDHIAT